jgi:hypothetical protein
MVSLCIDKYKSVCIVYGSPAATSAAAKIRYLSRQIMIQTVLGKISRVVGGGNRFRPGFFYAFSIMIQTVLGKISRDVGGGNLFRPGFFLRFPLKRDYLGRKILRLYWRCSNHQHVKEI